MRIYASRKQAEMVVIAMMNTFGSSNAEALKLIENVNKCLLNQCTKDNSHHPVSKENN